MRVMIILITAMFLFAADLDFDGISDNKDYCPRTSLLAVVDKYGCKIDKKIPFNMETEFGYEYIFSDKISQDYLKATIDHKSFEGAFFISKVKLNSSYHTYTKLFSLSKRFYKDFGYYKLSFMYYFKTYYNKEADKALKLTCYLSKQDILMYYKFKYTPENNQHNIHTIFIEKFIKYPKIILIPFFSVENGYYDNKINKNVGISSIVRLKEIYLKVSFSKVVGESGSIVSISIGKSF